MTRPEPDPPDQSATAVTPPGSPPRDELYVAVAGRWQGETDEVLRLAEQVGKGVARCGHILLTGGGPGVMEAVCRGNRLAAGRSIAYLGGTARTEANGFVDIALPTGLGWELRSQLVVRACDVLILIGGGAGSLAEAVAAYELGKPVVALRGSGGWADRLASVLVEGRYIDERRRVEMAFGTSPHQCVDLAGTLGRRHRASDDRAAPATSQPPHVGS